MKKYFFCIFVFLFMVMFVGCGGLQKSPICSVAPEESLICQKIGNPEIVDLMLRINNDEMLYKQEYTAAEAEAFLNVVEEYILNINTYSDLAQTITTTFNLLPDRIRNKIFILSDALYLYTEQIPICDFDRSLLLKEVAAQREIVRCFK